MHLSSSPIRVIYKALLTASLVLTSLCLQAQKLESVSKTNQFNPAKEDISKRTLRSKHYLNSDGSFSGVFYPMPIHYYHNGKLDDINTAIVRESTPTYAGYPLVNKTNLIQSYFAENAQDGLLSVADGIQIREFKHLTYFWQTGNSTTTPIAANNALAVSNNNNVTYPNLYPSVDARFTTTPAKRELQYIINSNAFMNGAPAGADFLVFNEDLEIDPTWTYSIGDNGILLRDAQDSAIAFYPSPTVLEGNGANQSTANAHVRYQVHKNGGTLTVSTLVDAHWLTDSQRVYPISIDPSSVYLAVNNLYWTGYNRHNTTNYVYSDWVKVDDRMVAIEVTYLPLEEHEQSRPWAKFDITGVPWSAATLQSATINHYFDGSFAPSQNYPYCLFLPWTIPIKELAVDPVLATGPAIDSSLIASTRTWGTLRVDTFSTSGISHYSATTTIGTTYLQDDINRGQYSIRLGYYPPSTFYSIAPFVGRGADYPNVLSVNLVITYTLPTITTGTVSSPICPGATVSVPFTLTGTYTAGNVFTAQLSDSVGSFANPINIGTLSGTTAGSITATVPYNTIGGSQYLIRVIASNPNITGSSTASSLTIATNPAYHLITTGNTCLQNDTLKITRASAATQIKWYNGSTLVKTANSSGGNIDTLYVPIADGVYYAVATTAQGCTFYSDTINIHAAGSPSVSISASATSICAGTQVVFTATPTLGGINPTYQWKVNGTVVGGNSNTYTASNLNNNDTVKVVMTSGSSCATPGTATSNAIVMAVTANVTPTVNILAIPAGPICAGTSVQFLATATNGGSPSYQWYVNSLPSGTGNIFTSSTLANYDSVKVVMTSTVGCVTSRTAKNAVLMTVFPNLTPTVTICNTTNGTLCRGTNATFAANITNGGTTPAYQWTVNGVNTSTDSTFSSSTLNNHDTIQVIITTSIMCPATLTATSNKIGVTVNPNVSPTITLSASPSSACVGASVLQLNGISGAYSIVWKRDGAVDSTMTYSRSTTGTTFAGGNGTGSGLNQLGSANALAFDRAGNVYVADKFNNRVLKFPPNSTSATMGTVVAGGNGTGTALNQIYTCYSVAMDANDTLYVSDNGNNRILKFPPGSTSATMGTIVAGGNGAGTSSTQLTGPTGIYVDPITNYLYVADYGSNRIQRFPQGSTSATGGFTVAGGTGGSSGRHQLHNPVAIAFDSSGYMYISDQYNQRVIAFPPGSISGTSGTVVAGWNSNGSNPNQLYDPLGIAVDWFGYLFVADQINNRVQRFPPGSTTSTFGVTVAGGNGQGSGATQLYNPACVSIDVNGNLLVGDYRNWRIQKFANTIPTTYAPTLAGDFTAVVTTFGGCQVTVGPVTFNTNLPQKVSIKASSTTLCAGVQDTFTATPINAGTNRVYTWYKNNSIVGTNSTTYIASGLNNNDSVKVVLSSSTCNGVVASTSPVVQITVNQVPNTTLVQSGNGCTDKAALNLSSTAGIANIIWENNGNVVNTSSWYGDSVGTIVAGNTNVSSGLDGLWGPDGIDFDAAGNMYVAEFTNSRIMKYPPNSTMGTTGTIFAGSPTAGVGALNRFYNVQNIFIDGGGYVYAVDRGNNRILKFPPNSDTTTLGIVVAGGHGMGSDSTQLNNPVDVFVDPYGNVYVSDASNYRVQKWAPGATYGVTVAGGNGYGVATNQLAPSGIFVDKYGQLYVAESVRHRVVMYPPNSTSATIPTVVAGTNNQAYGSDASTLHSPNRAILNGMGQLYVADNLNYRTQLFPPNSRTGSGAITVMGGNGNGTAPNQLNSMVALYVKSRGIPTGEMYGATQYNIVKWLAKINGQYIPTAPGSYNAIVTTYGGCTATTNAITVNTGASVSISATKATLCTSVADTFTATATNTGSNVAYTWYKNGSVVGTNNATFITSQLSNNDSVWVRVTNSIPTCGGNDTVWSNKIVVAIAQQPSLTLTTTGNCIGLDTLKLTGNAEGTTIYWQNNGVTVNTTGPSTSGTYGDVVAGSYSGTAGSSYYLLSGPGYIYVDTTDKFTVTDFGNNRVQQFTLGNINGTTLAGGNGVGSNGNQTPYPAGLSFDPTGNLLVGVYNAYIKRYPPSSSSTTLGTIIFGTGFTSGYTTSVGHPFGMKTTSDGYTYIADIDNHRILRIPPNCSVYTYATVVAGGNGSGSALNQLNAPSDIAFDSNGNLYVCDRGNHRVMRFPPGSTSATNGVVVAGGNGAGSALNQFNVPENIFIDSSNSLLVSDGFNHRVMKFPPNSNSSTNGFVVAGGNGSGTNFNQLNVPVGIFVRHGLLYVADHDNNRICIFSYPTSTSSKYKPTTSGTYTAIVTDYMGCTTNLGPITMGTSVAPTATVSASTTVMCMAVSDTFTATITGGGSAPSYQWYKNGTTVGTNSSTYITSSLSNNDSIWVVLTSNSPCASVTTVNSNKVRITINPTPVISLTTTGICAHTDTLKLTGASTVAKIYWRQNGNVLDSAINTGSIDTTFVPTVGGSYSAMVIVGGGCNVTSTSITFLGNTSPTVSISTPQSSICSGSTIVFTATGTNGGGSPTYQWKRNGQPVGTNSITYSYNGFANGDVVTCELTSSATCPYPLTAVSNSITTTVTQSVTPTVSFTSTASNDTVCSGVQVTFTATSTNGGGTPSYTWLVNSNNVGTGATYSTTGLHNGDIVSVQLTSTAVCASPTIVTSAGHTITVISSVTPTVSIVASPSGTICSGTQVTLTANTTNGGTVPSYNWLVNGVGTGAINSSYTTDSLHNGDQVVVAMSSNATCAVPSAVLSPTFTASVTNRVTPSVTISASPSGTVCNGANITFTPSPTNGGTPTYQWYVNNNPVATGSTYSSSSLNNGDVVKAVMTTSLSCVTASTATSNSITVTTSTPVTPAVGITANPSGIICSGTSVTFNTSPTNGGNPSYQWYVNNNPVATGSAYTTSGLSNNDVVKAVMTTSLSCVTSSTATSNTITMTVTPSVTPSVSISASPSGTVCSSTGITFTPSPTNGGGSPTYQWYVNNNPVATGATYTSSSLSNGDQVKAVMASSASCPSPSTATSNTVIVSVTTVVTPSVSIAASPSGTVCSGTNITFTPTPINGGTPTYQWYVNNNPVATGSTYSNSSLNNGDVVKVVLTSSLSCVTSSTATSNNVTVSTSAAATPSVTIAANPAGSICAGTNVTFTPTPTNGGTPTYQWYLNNNPVATGATYSNANLHQGDVIKVVMTSSLGCVTSSTATSADITMTVTTPVTPQVSILVSPFGTVCVGTSLTFTPAATYGGPSPTYQWYLNNNPVATGSTYTSSTLSNGDQVKVIMTSSAACPSPSTAVSNPATVSMSGSVTPSVSISANPSGMVCSGTNITFTPTPTNGGTPTYQWYVNNNPVATGSTYSSSSLNNGDIVKAVMTSSLSCVTAATATSNNITVATSTAVTPSVTIAANPAGSICAGTNVTFTPTPTNGGTPTYQWYLNNNPVTTGATYSNANLHQGDVIKVVMTSSLACVTSPMATSNTVTMSITTNVTPAVNIVASPSGTVCAGTSVSFTPSPTNGGTPSYQWYVNNNPVATGSTYTSSSLNNNDVVKAVMTSSLSCVTSPTATSNSITAAINNMVTPTVGITANPSGAICPSTPVTFTASPVNGGSGPTYQWLLNGAIVGTGATYSNSALNNNDTVKVVMTSNATCATTATATAQLVEAVSSNLVPLVSITASTSGAVCVGSSVTFTPSSSGGGNSPTFRWYVNNSQVSTASSFTSTTLANGDVVKAMMTSSAACASPDTAVSNSITMTINNNVTPSVSITTNPSGATCQGTNVTFTPTPTNGGNSPTYDWYVGSTLVSTGASYASTTLANGDVVKAVIHSNATCASPDTAVSNSVTMTVNTNVTPSVNITTNPSGTICQGTNVTFTPTPTNGGSSPAYQWTVNGTNVSTSPTYGNSSLSNGDVVKVAMTSNATCSTTPTAFDSVVMNVNSTVTPSVSIIASPSGHVCQGTSISFTPTVSNGGTLPTYQWKVNGTQVATGSSFVSTQLNNGDTVSVVVASNQSCASPATASSNTIIVAIDSMVTPSASIVANPTGAICAGTPVLFSANTTNGGSAPNYLWLLNGNPVAFIDTFSSSTLANGDQIDLVFGSSLGCVTTGSALASTYTVVVNNIVTPSVSIMVDTSGRVCAGTTLTFTAMPNNGGTPSYQWYVNGNIAATGDTLSTSALNDGDSVRLVMTSSLACATIQNVSSNTILAAIDSTVTPSVSITAIPQGAVCTNTAVDFTAHGINGGNASYQWLINGTNVDTGSTFSTTTLQNGDEIKAVMTSTAACVSIATANSNILTETVNTPTTPQLQQLGDTLVSTPSTSYQWFEDTTAINGANSDTLIVSHSGHYAVETTDGNGCMARSALINVTVTGIDQASIGNWLVYPNPTDGLLNIHLDQLTKDQVGIKLFDATGRVVVLQDIAEHATSLNAQLQINQLAAGPYLLQISQGSTIMNKHIVLIK